MITFTNYQRYKFKAETHILQLLSHLRNKNRT